MTSSTQPTDSLNFSSVRQQLSEIVNQVARRERRVLVEKHGVPVAAIVSPDDLKRLDALDEDERRRTAAFRAISERLADLPLDELEREIERSVAAVRRNKTFGQ